MHPLLFATCAAECNTPLRWIVLQTWAAHHPDVNTIDRMVRLIEAAPTWASDRAQGARVLLTAIAAGTLPGSQSQRLTWTWKLARASRETQYRAATAASPAIRDLLRTLASSRGEEHHVRARLLVASLRQVELPIAAAALAAALTHDAIAARTIETARAELPADVEALAAAFASNLPEQKAEPPAKPRRTRKKRPKERPAAEATAAQTNGHAAEVVGATVVEAKDSGDAPSTAPDGSPARKRRRRRRRRKGPGEGGGTPAGGNGTPAAADAPAAKTAEPPAPAESQANGTTPAPKPRPRRRRSRAVMDAASIGLPPKSEEG